MKKNVRLAPLVSRTVTERLAEAIDALTNKIGVLRLPGVGASPEAILSDRSPCELTPSALLNVAPPSRLSGSQDDHNSHDCFPGHHPIIDELIQKTTTESK